MCIIIRHMISDQVAWFITCSAPLFLPLFTLHNASEREEHGGIGGFTTDIQKMSLTPETDFSSSTWDSGSIRGAAV